MHQCSLLCTALMLSSVLHAREKCIKGILQCKTGVHSCIKKSCMQGKRGTAMHERGRHVFKGQLKARGRTLQVSGCQPRGFHLLCDIRLDACDSNQPISESSAHYWMRQALCRVKWEHQARGVVHCVASKPSSRFSGQGRALVCSLHAL
jgi:hypothetical protein